MAFRNDNIELPNATGRYDNTVNYFGNNVRIRAEIGGTMRDLYEYYIKNIKVRAEKTTLVCGDRREKLSQKIPGARFTEEEYPKIKKELIGELKQDVYGTCEWINCTCVDALDIFLEDGATKKPYRTFYAARQIQRLTLVDDRPGKNGQVLHNRV